MIKKHMIALFIKTGMTEDAEPKPIWTRIKKSTELEISMEAKTEEYDYIADERPTTEIEEYKPSIKQLLKMIKGEPDFDYFWSMFYNMKVGNDAKTEYMIVFMFDNKGTAEAPAYAAWSDECTISFESLNGNNSELAFDIALGANTKKGTATVTGTAPDYVPVFTAA